MPQRSRPAWFGPATTAVLDGAVSLTSARGPREVEARTAELLGAELHRVLRDHADGLWFADWFEQLADSAAERVREGGQPALWLLHGLTSIGTPALASSAALALARLPSGDAPPWLGDLGRVAATGEVFRMRDMYGTRYAVLAAFAYGHGDPFVYLFDIDASGVVKLAGAGDFDDVDTAAAAWRETVGDAAGEAPPQPVENAEELLCLAHLDVGDEMVMGDEPRVVMDNWFRAQRRVHDLFAVIGPASAAESLYHDIDITPMTEQFTSWYTERHGSAPNAESVEALATEWMEGALPETWYSVSPQRIEFLLGLIRDWIQDPITHTVRSLLPDWADWLSERADLPQLCREQVRQALVPGGQVPTR